MSLLNLMWSNTPRKEDAKGQNELIFISNKLLTLLISLRTEDRTAEDWGPDRWGLRTGPLRTEDRAEDRWGPLRTAEDWGPLRTEDRWGPLRTAEDWTEDQNEFLKGRKNAVRDENKKLSFENEKTVVVGVYGHQALRWVQRRGLIWTSIRSWSVPTGLFRVWTHLWRSRWCVNPRPRFSNRIVWIRLLLLF
jgi:hypothetical protein